MQKVSRAINFIANMGGYFSGWLVLIMGILVLFEVVMRYIVRQPPIISEEFAAYILVVMSFIGAAYTYNEKGHVRITMLVSMLPRKVADWLRVCTLLIVAVFCILLTKSSYDFLIASFKYKIKSGSWLNTPLQIPHMILIIGFAILTVVILVKIARSIADIRAGKIVEEECLK